MDLHQHLHLMARYHHWASQRLYQAVDRLSDHDYRADLKLHFKSVHNTLNHILLVDEVWQGRLKRSPFPITGLDQELEPGRTRLRQRILDFAEGWREFVDALTPDHLAGDLEFLTTKGDSHCMPYASLIAHAFNHATHHRGQISAALTQLGVDAPVMDFPYFLVELPRDQLHLRVCARQ